MARPGHAYRTALGADEARTAALCERGGHYRNVEEDEAYLRFVEAIEGILAEEQQIYWQSRGSELPAGKRPKSTGPGDAGVSAWLRLAPGTAGTVWARVTPDVRCAAAPRRRR